MASFRFLHTADIHLDSPLKGLEEQEDNVAKHVQNATREAFDHLISLSIEEKIDFLVIAGDLYDGNWRDYKTGLFFVRQMGRLNVAGIPVYLLHGNHDAESQITRRLELPENVHVFGAQKPETFKLHKLNVALHGQSFLQRDVSDNLVPNYPDPISGVFNIGVLHTALEGAAGHANYAPCSLSDLINKGYDYWALGHVHKEQIKYERPYIVFPGNLQGRHIKETGSKGAYLVTVEDNEVELAHTPCDVVRWAVLRVSLDNVNDLDEVNDLIRDALKSFVGSEAEGRLLICRVVLEGRTKVHDHLLISEDLLLVEARASALGFGDDVAWVEKIVIGTESITFEDIAQREDAIGALQQILQNAKGDKDLLKDIEKDIGELVRRLPLEARGDTEDQILDFAVKGGYADLIDEIIPYLLARLTIQES